MEITHDQVLKALSYVEDPDLKKDLVTLNMIRDLSIDGLKVSFTVMLTTPACPLKAMIEQACRNAIIHYVSPEADVNIKMDAQVTTHRGSEEELIPGVKNVIAVASGKGGVGKSTVAINLAIALAQNGAAVGLLDADIYGPSQPIMFGVENERLYVREKEGKSYMEPVEKFGVKMLSIGFMADTSKAIIWRGPMASNALRQLFSDGNWGELDYLIVDLPPGTGDIHMTMASAVPVTGAVIVSTPQKVALADARRGVSMFQNQHINIPVIGLIENMAYFTPEELPENKYFLFGKEGCKRLSEELELPFLGQIPIVQSICEGGDKGEPIVIKNSSPASVAFRNLAEQMAQQISIINARKNITVQAEN
jgi:ATP-binding protein involved in chromosome partitioning